MDADQPPSPVARWVLPAATVCLAAAFFVPAFFVATVMPYRGWDALAYGSWSRVMELAGGFTSHAPDVFVQRPLFYVGQGMLWHWFGFHQATGRWFSGLFSVLLVAALWPLASRLATASGRSVVPTFAVTMLLAAPVFAVLVAGGMTDIPVAAGVTATGALAFARRGGTVRLVLVGLAATATILAKPTGLLGLLGLVLALGVAARADVGLRRGAGASVAAVAIGTVPALVYAIVMARRLDESVPAFLTSGNSAYFRARAAAGLSDRLLTADWLGNGLRLPLLFGLTIAIARTVGARGRRSTAAAALVAVVWATAGPVLAHGGAPYPFAGASALGVVGTMGALSLLLAAVVRPGGEPLVSWAWPAMLVWLVPTALPAIAIRSDEVRFLSPAWAPAAILAAGGLACGAAGLARLWAPALVPVVVVTASCLVLTNVSQIDGLGGSGWSDLRALGRSGWSSQAAMENYAYGPLSYQIATIRTHAGSSGQIFSSDGRLAFFFPGRVGGGYAGSCAALRGSRVFTLLTGGESKDIMERIYHSTADPLAWIQCASPRLRLVLEQPGEYATFVVGPPQPPPAPAAACRIVPYAGRLDDAVFGERLTYRAAVQLDQKARSVAYPARIERTGCDRFRVVVTGIPQDAAGQKSFRAESARVGLDPHFTAAVRYPEVPADIAAPPPR